MKRLIAHSIIGIFFTSVALVVMVSVGNLVQRNADMEDDLAVALAIGAPVVLACFAVIGLLFWAVANAE